MSRLYGVTMVVHPDEPAIALTEIDEQAPGNKGWHRYQTVRVLRGDWPADYKVDLGPRSNFVAEQFAIPGAVDIGHGHIEILHTVGELMEIADWLRERKPDHDNLRRQNLFDGYEEYAAKKRMRRNNVGCRNAN